MELLKTSQTEELFVYIPNIAGSDVRTRYQHVFVFGQCSLDTYEARYIDYVPGLALIHSVPEYKNTLHRYLVQTYLYLSTEWRSLLELLK